MSRSHFESQQSSSFNRDSEPKPFHNNLHYQEVLATLRYGIIARRGLIVLVGDPGAGKTTLLHQLTRELDTNVTCIFESDADVNFTDLLRLVLGNLEGSRDARNGLSMMQRCKTILRSQMEEGHIVSLVIDNAQRLRDETLEYLLHNFFGVAPVDRDENLLQIVLAGSPELAEKLAQARLRPLKPRSGLVCQLQPLRDKQMVVYVKSRLRAAQLPEDTFDDGAMNRIFAYTGGNPQMVNDLCDHALQFADESPDGKITAATISRAARDLQLSEVQVAARKTAAVEPDLGPQEPEERFPSADGDSTEVEGQTFPNYTFDDGRPRLRRGGRGRKTFRVLLILLLLGGGALWFQSEAGKAQFSQWIGRQNSGVGAPPGVATKADPPRSAKQEVPSVQAPSSEMSSPETADSASSRDAISESEKLAEVERPFPAQKPPDKPQVPAAKSPPRKVLPQGQINRQAMKQDPEVQKKLLEAQIHRAIENRAITGVTVSVIENITYLDGRVATVRQRNAAEQAARSVTGVERVRNRIAVAGS